MKTTLDKYLARLPFKSTKTSSKPFLFNKVFHKLRAVTLALIIGATGQAALAAPTNIMVPFSDGFFGDDDGNNTIDALDVQTFSDLGLSASFFQQTSGTSAFEDAKTNTTDPVTCVGGNDVPGRLRIRLGGVFTDIPGCIDGKYKEGGATVAFSFNPKAAGSITINAANPANNIVVNPASTGLLNIGIVINNYSNADLTPTNSSDANKNGQLDSGEDISGDSSGILVALNDYLTTADTNAPNGSISVDEKTYITPNAGDIVLTGSYDFGTTIGEELAVIVNGILYNEGTSGTDVVIPDGSGGWTLTLSTDLSDDTVYDVDAWIINDANWILQDPTSGELTILGAAPSLSLVKTAVVNKGADGVLQAGETVTYTYVVKNTGAIDVTEVTITESVSDFTGTGTLPTASLAASPLTDHGTIGDSSDDGLDANYDLLASEDHVTFTSTYTVTQADLDAGSLTNQATVTAKDPSLNDVTDTSDDGITGGGDTGDDPTVTGLTQVASIEGTKTAAVTTDLNSDGFGVGDTITYTVTATNTGNVTLTGVDVQSDTLTQADDTDAANSLSSFTIETGGSTTLAPGDSVSFTATYVVAQADIDAGGLKNTATVVGTPPSGATNNVTDVTDDDDDDDGNTADDKTELLVTAAPGLSITKATTDDDGTITGAAVGTTVTWTVTATNTGNVSLTYGGFNDALTADADETFVGLDTDGDTTFDDTTALTSASVLAPGQSWQWTVDYDLTQADMDAGAVENIASVAVSAPGDASPTTYYSGSDATASSATSEPASGARVTIPQSPLLKVTKTVDDTDLDDGVRVGDTLVYTIKVENLGNVTLKGVDLTDTFQDVNSVALTLTSGPTKTGDTGTNTSDTVMEPGDVWTYAASFDLTEEVISAGGVENIAMVSAYVDTNENDTKDTGETVVTAESKVGGNTSSDGDGTPTETGFPGEVNGTVRNYMKGVEGVTVYLLQETSTGSGVFDYVLDPSTNQPIMTTTDADGKYGFVNLPIANYGVEFDDPNSSKDPTAKSAYNSSGNRITGIEVGAGEVEIEQDAFFIDPAGIVYDTTTYDPIQGAVVSLYYQPTVSDPKNLVLNSWLDTTLGDTNEVTTGSDGTYIFLLDASAASDGIYSLEVVKEGYTYVSSVIAPMVGPFDAGLGGGIVKISSDATTYDGMDETYYTSFDMVFTGSAATTSNGVAQNHLPMDPSDLIPLVEDDLLEILKDDLASTMTQQSRQMGSFAKGALSRLKAQPSDTCAVDLNAAAPVLFDNNSSIVRSDQSAVLDDLASILETCEDTQFEIAGHTDSNASDDYNLVLSQARVNAIRTALVARGVDADRLVSQGYGESQPVADNATAEGRAENRRVEFVPMQSVDQTESCTDSTDMERSMTASISNRGVSASGDLYSEKRDCASNSWRIVEGKASYLETTDGMAQGMFSLSVRRETLKDDYQVAGRFIGVYASQNSVTGLATGRIDGYGINAGLYGAQRLQDQLYADYYLGAAAGRHFFDLDFARTGGTIGTSGHYDYTALFAGAALSGETEAGSVKMTPRVGVDLAYSPGGTVAVTAARGSVEDSASLSLASISGLRGYVEVGFNDLTTDETTVLSFTPKAFCDRPIGGTAQSCGAGVSVEYSAYDEGSDMTYGFKLDAEKSGSFTYGALSANYSVPLGHWVASGTASVDQDGNASLSQIFSLNF